MENGLDGKDCSPSDEEESDMWTEKEEEVLQDIGSDEPLPEPTHHQSSMQVNHYFAPVACVFFATLAGFLQNK